MVFWLAALLPTTSAFLLPLPDYDFPAPQAVEPPSPEITAGPALEAVDWLLRKRDDADANCASSCFIDAITKSTNCIVGDYACQCQGKSATAIAIGADACMFDYCGYTIEAGQFSLARTYSACSSGTDIRISAALSAASSICRSALDSQYTATYVAATTQTFQVATTASNGRPTTLLLTNTVVAPAVASPTSSSSSSLSTGAIAGIAVGCFFAAVLFIGGLLFAFWYGKRRGGNKKADVPPADAPPSDNSGAVNQTVQGGSGAGVAVFAGAGAEAKSELETSVVSTTPSPPPPGSNANMSLSSPPGSTLGVISPLTPPPVYFAQLPQQQHAQYVQYQQGGQQPVHEAPSGLGVPSWNEPQEVQGAWPEMPGDSQVRHEMSEQSYNRGPYEMPGGGGPTS